jgi:L-asparaginase
MQKNFLNMARKPASVLVIYTGGTIGMVKDAANGSLMPVNFERLLSNIPEISRLDIQIDIHTFDQTIDSSNIQPAHWIQMVEVIEQHYEQYDGFVVLHGSDTMAFSASAVSFMIENLSKPVIFTGSQLPIGVLRTDARENFITALEIAAMKESGRTKVSEVCIYFEYHLLKGNRTTKFSSSNFNAFTSANYASLAEAGVQIIFNDNILRIYNGKPTRFHKQLNTDIAILKIFPGMTPAYLKGILETDQLKAVVMETFGSGNAPTDDWFIDLLDQAIRSNIIIVNVTQCTSGAVFQGKYKTSERLQSIGVLSGHDITTEAALTKLMFLLGNYSDTEEVKQRFCIPLKEEMTLYEWT